MRRESRSSQKGLPADKTALSDPAQSDANRRFAMAEKRPRRGFCMLQGALPGPYFPGFHVPLNSGARFLCSRFLCSRFLPFPDSFVPAFLCFSLLVFPGWRGGHFGYSLPPAPGTGFPPPASVAGMPGRSSSPADSSVRAECCFLVCRRAVLRSRSPTRMMLSLPVQSRL